MPIYLPMVITRTQKRKRRRNTLIIVIVSLILLAVVAWQAGWLKKENEIAVTFAKAGYRTIVERVTASGTLQPEKEVKISPDVPGEIVELYVKEGDSVPAGKLLISIRPDIFEASLSRSQAMFNQQQANYADAKARLAGSKAQLTQAELAFKRNKDLYESKVISESDFEQAETTYKVAQQDLESAAQAVEAARYAVSSASASVQEARENLLKTEIYAPVSGIVSKLDVEKGERVVGTSQMAGTEMLRIADLSQMEVRVNVNENDIIRISVNDTAVVDVDAYSYMDKEFKAVVTAIANSANEKLSSEAVTEFEVRMRMLPSSYADLITGENRYPFRPGMTASVEILTERKENVLSVPLSAVTTRSLNQDSTQQPAPTLAASNDNRHEVVFVKNGEAVAQQPVTTGISDYDHIEVLSGLTAEQEIVSGPYVAISEELKDGSKVKPMTDEAKGRPWENR